MKTYRTKRFALLLLFAIVVSASYAQVRPATLEYWLDGQYAKRNTVSTDGNFTQNIDVSSLCYGIHTLEMRVSDTKGRWGGTLLRYFLKTDPTLASNKLTKYEYWIDCNKSNAVSGELTGELDLSIDVSELCQGVHSLQLNIADSHGQLSQTMFRHFITLDENPADRQLSNYEYWIDDYSNVKSGATSDGNIMFDIDVASLCKGIHTFNYQVQYSNGRKSSPRLVYFLIPDLEAGAGMIAAYEYWFNHGSRTRVDLSPASPAFSLDGMAIEVKDVVPNSLEDYRFDASAEQAEVDDNVFFGMQVYDADNRGSLAVLSDSFQMVVPIELNMLTLAADGEPLTVTAPVVGRMQGMKSLTTAGDSLTYTLSSQNVMADFYDASGNRLEVTETLLDTDEVVYSLKATTATTYALFYYASDVLNTISVSLLTSESTGIDDVLSSSDAVEVARYNANGQIITGKQRGINIIRMSDGSVRKVLVK